MHKIQRLKANPKTTCTVRCQTQTQLGSFRAEKTFNQIQCFNRRTALRTPDPVWRLRTKDRFLLLNCLSLLET